MWPRFEELAKKYAELESRLSDPALAADGVAYARTAKEHGALAKQVKPYLEYQSLEAEIAATRDAAAAEKDTDLQAYMEEELQSLESRRAALLTRLEDLVLVDPGEDFDSIIVEIRAGTGGEEAALFAGDLSNMYLRYAATQGWNAEPIDSSTTDLGGFREISFTLRGDGVFRHLRFESGGHRVQRVPKTETQGRIHTSAATVAILPEPSEVQIEINPDDVRIDTFSAGGPGGQHQNKTQSGVRLTHIPTGVVAESRSERSQLRNKELCWRVLRSRIYEARVEQERKVRAAARKSLIGSGDRSERIRTYNFPQNRVTDHRINETWYSLDRILAGDLAEVVRTLTAHDKKEQLAALQSA